MLSISNPKKIKNAGSQILKVHKQIAFGKIIGIAYNEFR
jgi:hypothetical protein